MKVPEVIPRRPYSGAGYMESDKDFMANNRFAAVWFLENRDKLAALMEEMGDEPA